VPVDPQGRLLLVAALGAGMAHDLRNVLAAAESSLYLAGKLGDDPAARAKHVDAARAHVRTAQGLVDRALAPARGATIHAEPIEVAVLCEMASRAWRVGEATTTAIDVEPGLSVVGDLLLLERALVNLVENADGAAEGRPLRVTLTGRAEDGCVRIEVRDDGPGIPDEVRARLFEPLATARPGGIGLGLPLVRAIAEAHGGRVEIESDDAGTRATLVLPPAAPTR
jgi:signal transduction histidine kinase